MDVWENQANALEKELAGFIDARPPAKWRAVQNALGPREAAVEFIRLADVTQPHYAAFVLTKDAPYPICVALCPEDSLPPLFDKKGNPVVSCYGANGNQALYHLVFEPLLPHLKGVQKVWYAPHGLLHFVNFPALAASKGQILAQTFDLTLLGSTKQVIGRQQAMTTVPSTALLLGDMDYGAQDRQASAQGDRGGWPSKQWQRLKGTRREVEDAARLLKAKGTKVETLVDTAANERAVRQHLSRKKGPSVLHFATHAFYMQDTNFTFVDLLDNGNPIGKTNPLQRAGIVMAGGNDAANPKRRTPDDGILSTQEIALLELSGTQLAVLSACDSGLGDLDPQEGVWGLTRAFRTAGAQNIISSLWKTNDDTAANFMKDFYHYWLVQGKNIHDAFHAAREAARAFNPDPNYWACFILSE